MEVQWILVCHGLVTLLVLVSFLCGQWPIFDGTPIQRINHFLTFGAYDYFQRFVGFVFGARGTNAIASVEYFCCDRPNPILQNNCIGERNTQYFVAFLLWHTLLCIYGTVAIGLILAGQVKEYKVIEILTAYYGVDNSFRGLTPHVVQWLLGDYNTQILLMVFLAIVALLLAGFFGYHAKLCLTNTTTNETYKWQDYMSWQKKLNEARASSVALKASISGISSERKPPESKWRAMFRRSPLEDAEVVVKNNIYDKGFFQNILEVIVPLSSRLRASRTKSKSG